jgi:voltage-gated potassium channel
MLLQLILATAMVVLTAVGHAVGLGLLTVMLRLHTRLFRHLRAMPMTLLLLAVLGIIAVHSVEIWLWAALYLFGLHAFAHFEEALYFSTVTYASIGYGDLLMMPRWRILAAIEGGAGIMMFGWSTAFVVSLLTQLKMLGHDWLRREHRD